MNILARNFLKNKQDFYAIHGLKNKEIVFQASLKDFEEIVKKIEQSNIIDGEEEVFRAIFCLSYMCYTLRFSSTKLSNFIVNTINRHVKNKKIEIENTHFFNKIQSRGKIYIKRMIEGLSPRL